MVDAAVTEKGPRRLELHVPGGRRPSLAAISGLGSQALCLAVSSFLREFLQQTGMRVK